MTRADDDALRGASGISMRTWLYLGAAVLGLSLMGLEGRPAEDHLANENASAPAEERSASVPVAVNAEAIPTGQSRSVKLEMNTRLSLR